MENTKLAARGDENSFKRELRSAKKSVHDSLERSAAIIRNTTRHLSKAKLAMIYNAMTKNYTDGLRALTEVLLAKDRMQLDHTKLPSGVLGHMAKMQGRIQTVTKHKIKKMTKKYKKQIKKIVKKAV